jgi:acyl-coenzyme A synthetase/AMP-(fatty) acid ligase
MLIDGEAKELEGNSQSGYLCFKQVAPSMARSIYGDHDRFKTVYYDVGACLDWEDDQRCVTGRQLASSKRDLDSVVRVVV